MKSLIKWGIDNSPALNVFLIVLLMTGAISLMVMPREVFPRFELEILLVSVPFPGATPEEVEQGICQKIEAAIANLEGIKKIRSFSQENAGFLVIELKGNVKDAQRVLDDVQSRIQQISTFPPRSERPEVRQIVFRNPAITVGLIGPDRSDDPDERLRQELDLRDLGEHIKEELLDLPAVPPQSSIRRPFAKLFQPSGSAVTSAEIVAAKPYEIAVEVSENVLQEYGLSLTRLASLIRLQNVEIPGGKLETASEEVLLRGKNKRETGEEIARIPVMSRPNGDVVTVGDLGVVIDGFAESVSEHIINGRRGLAISVTKTESEDLFTIVEAVRNYVENKDLPAGYELKVWGDISLDVRDRLDLLTKNGVQGLLVVFVCLMLFLNLRLAFWVAFGIPVALIGSGLILMAFGQSLNMLSMFSFLMALGIVVDDAIVIGENIFKKMEDGLSPVRAAVEGTAEVIPSVFASVSTTVIAFLPLLFVTGVMGKFISVMPLAVIAMLLLSLFEALLILPGHLAHPQNFFLKIVTTCLYVFKPLVVVVEYLNRKVAFWLEKFILTVYRPALLWSLANRRIATGVGFAMLIASMGLIAGGLAPFGFFPKLDARRISATVAFPNGTAVEHTREATEQLENAILRVAERVRRELNEDVVVNIYRKIGEVGNSNQGPTGVTNGSHVANVEVQLTQPEQRSISSERIIAMWREEIPKIAGSEILSFTSEMMGPGGKGIEFRLLANDQNSMYLPEAVEACKQYLSEKEGVFDIQDDARLGKAEMILKLNELGKSLGLDENSLANTIRASYFGEEVMRLQRGRHEVKLLVRYPLDERQRVDAFENIRIRGNDNLERPLLDVASIEYSRSLSTINRLNQKRAVAVSANVNAQQANAVDIVSEMQTNFIPWLIKDIRERHGAVISVNWEGEQADTTESLISMATGYFIAMLAIFVLLVFEFRSYFQPLIVMAIVPFGLVGAVLGHALLGLELTLFSFFGLVALTGVIVNDSIVLVDFINHNVRDGLSLNKAIVEAGVRRFRPILLTTLTTVGGLGPILLETSTQAQVLIPMVASLVFGLSTGTALILILVPVWYSSYGSFMDRIGHESLASETEHSAADWGTPQLAEQG
ncbi:MAG: efflux RND transporter permease subunit [Pirellulaceae bacterium]|nr:efflux RND transporter permease subunit [Pirellulaceae bacterium]